MTATLVAPAQIVTQASSRSNQEEPNMAKTLVLVLPVDWPFPPLVDIPPEDRPRVAMHIANAFLEEARRWEQQAFQLAADLEAPSQPIGLARPSITKGDQRQGSPAHSLT